MTNIEALQAVAKIDTLMGVFRFVCTVGGILILAIVFKREDKN